MTDSNLPPSLASDSSSHSDSKPVTSSNFDFLSADLQFDDSKSVTSSKAEVAGPTIPTDISGMLRRAAQLMQDGDKSGAKQLVSGILKTTQENPDAWYLYASLVDEHPKKIQGLERALSINPQHARAQQMLVSLRSSNDVFGDILPGSTHAPVYQPQAGAMPMQQPIVYVNVNQSNDNNLSAGAVLTPKVNQTALIIGFIAAGFFGIFGVAQLLNGKIGGALGRFILGLVWIAMAFGVTGLTAGLGACVTIPLHFFLAWTWSKQGATST